MRFYIDICNEYLREAIFKIYPSMSYSDYMDKRGYSRSIDNSLEDRIECIKWEHRNKIGKYATKRRKV